MVTWNRKTQIKSNHTVEKIVIKSILIEVQFEFRAIRMAFISIEIAFGYDLSK